MKSILFNVKNPQRFSVHGYHEWGSTTTPFDLLVRNQTDRYHLAIEVAEQMYKDGVISQDKKKQLVEHYEKALSDHYDFITTNGHEPIEIENWQWKGDLPTTVGAADVLHTDHLKNARTIAFVGLSDKPERHSNRVAKFFQEKGYRIIPVNPNVKEVLGEKAYPNLLSIPQDIHIDIVDIFRDPSEVIPHMEEVVERGNIRTVWLAEGINTPQAEDFAEDYGLSLVTNFCIMEAYKQQYE
jgi:predicted CoA-binding protein